MAETNTTEGYAPFDLYAYNPAQPPAYLFLGLFGATAVVHFVLMFPYRCAFPIPMIIGCGMEAAGYYFRSRSHDNIRQTLPYLIQTLMLLASPPFLAATVYMSLRRMMRALRREEYSLIGTRWLSKLFVLVDLACFVTQVAGVIMSGSEDLNTASQGRTIILTGLILQIVAFVFFSVCVLAFQVRMTRMPSSIAFASDLHWKRYFMGLQVVSVLFIIRSIVRVVEYNQGNEGEIINTEAFLYVFDSCFMISVVSVVMVLHPGRLVRKANRVGKSRLGDDCIPLE